MLCPAAMSPVTVDPQAPGDPLPRRIHHLVICVHDLAQAALDWRTLGFSLTPTGVHPFGTSNRLAMFGNNYLELLAVTDAAAVPPATPDRFSFAAHNRDFLASAEGMSLLALHSDDAHADAARFKAHHIGDYAPFDFGRDAVLPGGGTARVEFSLGRRSGCDQAGIERQRRRLRSCRRRAARSTRGVTWSGAGIHRTGDNLTWLKSSGIIPQASTRRP